MKPVQSANQSSSSTENILPHPSFVSTKISWATPPFSPTPSSASISVPDIQNVSVTFEKLSIVDKAVTVPEDLSIAVTAPGPFLDPSGATKTRRRSSVLRRISVSSVRSENSIAIPIEGLNRSVFAEEDDDNEFENINQETTLAIDNEFCHIANYETIKVLGFGAYGKVYLTKHKRTGHLYAQKEMKKASVTVDKKLIERTLSERSILSSINAQPNIVKLFHAFHDKNKLYLMLQYIPGGELFQYLASEKFFSQKVTSFYSAQMILALRHLHGLGIVYRDLKPENCLLNERGYLVLTDFGLSKDSTDSVDEHGNFCNSIIGTPDYVAPEVLKGEPYGMTADWWSLGTVIYDMLTGSPPFSGNSHKIISDKILKSKVKYPFYLTNEVKDLLNKLLNKNPQKRFNIDEKWDVTKKHMFFRLYDWEKLANQEYDPPITPVLTNISSDCTEVPGSRAPSSIEIKASDLIINENDNYFDGFSYSASNSYIERYIN